MGLAATGAEEEAGCGPGAPARSAVNRRGRQRERVADSAQRTRGETTDAAGNAGIAMAMAEVLEGKVTAAATKAIAMSRWVSWTE
jgi:hypothetical protein